MLNSTKTNGYLIGNESEQHQQQMKKLKEHNSHRKSSKDHLKLIELNKYSSQQHHQTTKIKQQEINLNTIDLIQQSDKDLNNNTSTLQSNGLRKSNLLSNGSNNQASISLNTNGLTTNNFTNHLVNNNLINLVNGLPNSVNGTSTNSTNLNGISSSLSSSLTNISSSLDSLTSLNAISTIDLANHLNDNLSSLLPLTESLHQYPLLNQQIQLNNNFARLSPNTTDSIRQLTNTINNSKKKSSLDFNQKDQKKIGKLLNYQQKSSDPNLLNTKMNLFDEPIKKICKVCGNLKLNF